MSYDPKDGVDYLIDLYAVAGVEQAAAQEDIKSALNQRAMEYHPDRLQGLAPEFQTKGERMARLLNRGRAILLDADKRAEYDEILQTWEGPVSTDGIPVMNVDSYKRGTLRSLSPEELEDSFSRQEAQAKRITNYKPNALTAIEVLAASQPDNETIRTMYEDALLQADVFLSIMQDERGTLLGLKDGGPSGNRIGLDHVTEIKTEIETAREEVVVEERRHALGGQAARLALLAGESASVVPASLDEAAQTFLPAYYEQQAAYVLDLAEKRLDILEKRLANLQPTYPDEELQTEGFGRLMFQMVGEAKNSWFSLVLDAESLGVTSVALDEVVAAMLEAGDYESVIEQGYNVMTVKLIDHVDPNELLATVVEKYGRKYGLITD